VKKLSLMMVVILSAVVSSVSQDGGGLPVRNTEDPAHNTHALYMRASESNMVAIGTVLKREGVKTRETKAQTEEMAKTGKVPPNYDPTKKYGRLYTISLEQILCHQSDFQASPQTVPADPTVIYLFVPDEGLLNVETPSVNEHDLLFLVTPPDAEQKQWVKEYDLDRDRIYYQAKWRGDGVVSLSQPGETPPILDKVTKLCEAVQPSDVATKIAALEKLIASDDPVLQKEAAEAKKGMQKPQ